MPPPGLAKVLETILYVSSMPASRKFYESTLRLTPMLQDSRATSYPLGTGPSASVLLLFVQGATTKTVRLPDGRGEIPFHGPDPEENGGEMVKLRQHVAFAVRDKDELREWEENLGKGGVKIEGRTNWPKGGESIYFRDPDEHLLEIASPGIWDNF